MKKQYAQLTPVMALVDLSDPTKIDIAVAGYEGPDGSDIVFSLDVEKGTLTRISTGESINFATDVAGANKRANMEVVPSNSDFSKEYNVYKIDANDPFSWICSCPDFTHRRAHTGRETCIHIGYAHNGVYKRLQK